ncbi:MAG TPA: AsmA family protein [Myxococcota bacterium]|nr:AsmA family protein [Myxococcota bacterium]
MRLRTWLVVVAALALLAAAGLGVFVARFDVERYRPEIVGAARRATGRELALRGPLSLGFLPPRIEARNVGFANAPWGTRPEMASIDRFALVLDLGPLLFERRLSVRSVTLSGVDLLLETNAAGEGNWVLAPARTPAAAAPGEAPPAEPGAAAMPEIGTIDLRRISLVYRNGATAAATQASVDRLTLEREDGGARLDLVGRFREVDLALAGRIGRLDALDGSRGPWPVDLTAAAAGASLALKGEIAKPLVGEGVDLTLAAKGESLADLSRLAGVALPRTKAWTLGGHLVHAADARWKVSDLALRAGPSGLAGNVLLVLASPRPRLAAKLDSTLLAVQDFLGGAWGEPVPSPPTPGAPPPAASSDSDRLFSDAPLPYAALGSVDASVVFEIGRLEARGATLRDVAGSLGVADAALALKLERGTLAGGAVSADLGLAAATQAASATVRATNVGLGQLTSEMGVSQIVHDGPLQLSAELEGHGPSLHAVMASLDGRLVVDVGAARLAARADELARTQLVRALIHGLVGGDETRLECLVARFDVAHGSARTRVLLAKSDRIDAVGDGTIDLGRETLELDVVPRRNVVGSDVELAVPLVVKGRLASPSVTPSPIGTLQGTVGSILPSRLRDDSWLRPLFGASGESPSLSCGQARAIAEGRAAPPPPAKALEKPLDELKQGLKKLFGR